MRERNCPRCGRAFGGEQCERCNDPVTRLLDQAWSAYRTGDAGPLVHAMELVFIGVKPSAVADQGLWRRAMRLFDNNRDLAYEMARDAVTDAAISLLEGELDDRHPDDLRSYLSSMVRYKLADAAQDYWRQKDRQVQVRGDGDKDAFEEAEAAGLLMPTGDVLGAMSLSDWTRLIAFYVACRDRLAGGDRKIIDVTFWGITDERVVPVAAQALEALLLTPEGRDAASDWTSRSSLHHVTPYMELGHVSTEQLAEYVSEYKERLRKRVLRCLRSKMRDERLTWTDFFPGEHAGLHEETP